MLGIGFNGVTFHRVRLNRVTTTTKETDSQETQVLWAYLLIGIPTRSSGMRLFDELAGSEQMLFG